MSTPTQGPARPARTREGSDRSDDTIEASTRATPAGLSPLITSTPGEPSAAIVSSTTAASQPSPRRASAAQQASLGRGRPMSMMSATSSSRPVQSRTGSSYVVAPSSIDPTTTLSRRSTSVATNSSRMRAQSRAGLSSSSDDEDGESSRTAPMSHRMSSSIEGVLGIGAHPSPSTRKDDREEEDDAVDRVDRGEELIKRRMRARKRERKEPERRDRIRREEDARRLQSRPQSGVPRSAMRDSMAVQSDTEYDALSQPAISRRPTFEEQPGLSDITLPQTSLQPGPLSPRSPAWPLPPPTPGRSTAASQRTERDVFSERFGDVDEIGEEHTGPIGVEQHDSSADDSGDDDVEYTLKDRQDAINAEHPFGLPIWKAALYKKSRSVTRNADQDLHSAPSYTAERHLLAGNIIWAIFFGLPLLLIAIASSFLLSVVPFGGRKYARVVYELATFIFWPFGKYVEGLIDDDKEIDEAPPPPRGYDHIEEEDEGETTLEDVEANGRTWGRSSQAPTLRPGDADATERSPLLLEREATIRPNGYGTDGKPLPTPSSQASDETAVHDGAQGIRVRALGRLAYWAVFYLLLAPPMLIACTLCWALVFTVPSARMLWALIKLLATEPLHLHFRLPPSYHGDAAQAPKLRSGQRAPRRSRHVYSADRDAGRYVDPSQARILLCVYRAMGSQYYKYTIGGINILFIDLMPLVFFVIFDYFLLTPGEGQPPRSGFLGFISAQMTIFVGALLSVIPLSYFIGMAVASISAQSSIGMGAVINATFGSLIEIFLYSFALVKSKADLVEGSIVGSLLAGVLLMPGLSMIGGAFRRKEQRFNARSAGVTSTMLVMASIGTLTPTLFYEIYGTLTCDGCPTDGAPGDSWSCSRCRYEHLAPADDPFYHSTVKYLSWYCAVILLLAYLVGLWFSLRTHASQIWQNAQGHGEAGAPRPSGAPKKLANAVDVIQRLLPHSKEASQHRQSQSIGNTSTVSTARAVTAPATPATRTASEAHPELSSSGLKLPHGLTVDEFNRAVEVVAATASVLRDAGPAHPPQSALAPGPLDRRVSHVSQAGDSHRREHSAKEEKEVAAASGGHDAPSWTRFVSYSVLLACTALYAVIAEILVDVVDVVLDGSGIPEKFLGVTLFALVPNTTEFVNAVSFALHGNIALSLEIGSAYALQVCLLQIPAMIAFSAIYNHDAPDSSHRMFTLVFPRWDLISILFSVFLLTYIYVEASSTYFRGSLLVLSYAILIAGFYMAPPGLDTENDPLLLSTMTWPITSALRAPDLSLSQKVMAIFYSFSPSAR